MVWYFRGDLEVLEDPFPKKSFFQARLIHRQLQKPVYSGTGKIFLQASLKSFHALDLNDEAFFLNPNTYVASETSVKTLSTVNHSIPGLKRGKGLIETHVSGTGQVLVLAPGRVQRVDLNNETFSINGALLIARSNRLEVEVSKTNLTSQVLYFPYQEFFYQIKGSGTLYFAPVPNKEILLEALNFKRKRSSFFRRSFYEWIKKRVW